MTIIPPRSLSSATFTYKPLKFDGGEGDQHTLRVLSLPSVDSSQIEGLNGHIFDDLSQFQPEKKWDERLVVDLKSQAGEEKSVSFNFSLGDMALVAVRESWADGHSENYPVLVYLADQLDKTSVLSCKGKYEVFMQHSGNTAISVDPINLSLGSTS